jgi:DNA-directed RNA polymerase specialized sigma24 family protein
MRIAPMPPDQALAVARLRQWSQSRLAIHSGKTTSYRREGWVARNCRQHDSAVVGVIDFDLALAELDAEQQVALVLTYRDRQTIPQIAIAIGCSERKVSYLVPAARAKLADVLDRRDLL